MEAPLNIRHARFLTLSINFCVLGLLGPSSQALAQGEDQEELKRIERELTTAVLHVAVATLELTYADDFRFTHSTGNVQTKAEWLRELQSGTTNYTARSTDSIEVELHDDVAITTGRIHARTDSSDPRWREYTVWYVRVYAERGGRWQLLSHRTVREQTGPLPAPESEVPQQLPN